MGSFSIWHWLILLVLFCIPAGIAMLVWLIVRYAQKRTNSKPLPPHDQRP
jgi:Flp pilus assembly protein TadB